MAVTLSSIVRSFLLPGASIVLVLLVYWLDQGVSPSEPQWIPALRNHWLIGRLLRGKQEEQHPKTCEVDVAWKISAEDWYSWAKEDMLDRGVGASMFLKCFSTIRSPLTLMNAAYFAGEAVAPREVIIPRCAYGLDMRMFIENPSAFPPEHEFHIAFSRQSQAATRATLTYVKLKAREISPSLELKNTALFPDLHRCDPTQPPTTAYLSDGKLLCNLVQIHPRDAVCIKDLESEALTDDCRSRIVQLLQQMYALEATTSGGDIAGLQPTHCKVTEILVDEDPRAAINKISYAYHETQCMLAKQCLFTDSKLPYDVLYVCPLDMNELVAFPLITAVSIFWFVAMGILTDVFLVPILVELGRAWHMSDALVGATLLALGDGCNDFMTGFVSVLSSKPPEEGEVKDGRVVEMWLGSLFGSVVFVNALCASIVLLIGGLQGVRVIKQEFIRNVGFQLVSLLLMAVYGMVGFLHWSMALLMMLIYVLYVLLILFDRSGVDSAGNSPQADSRVESVASFRVGRGQRTVAFGSFSHKHEGSFQQAQAIVTDSPARAIPLQPVSIGQPEACLSQLQMPVDSHAANTVCALMGYEQDGSVMDRVNFVVGIPVRPFFLVTMALTEWHPCLNVMLPIGMCVFIPFGNFFGNMYETAFEHFGATTVSVLAFWTVGILLSLWCGFASRRNPGVYIAPRLFYCASFIVALFWLSTMCSEVVGAMQTLGFICGIPPEALGLTLLAWGNSIDTLFSMVALAKAGQFGIAVTAIYAGPMFVLLFGTGFNLMMMSCKEGGRSEFTLSVSSWIVLMGNVLILIATSISARLMGWRLTKKIGYMLFFCYASVILLVFAVDRFLSHADGES